MRETYTVHFNHCMICAGVLLEYSFFSPAKIPLPRSEAKISTIYDNLEDGAVLDLPMTLPNLEKAVYVYYQSQHKSQFHGD